MGLTALAGSAIATVHTQAAEAVSPSNPPVPLTVPDGASGRWSGESAVSRLTGRLDAVGRAHGMTAEQLAHRLRTDRSLKVDANDRLLYVDAALPASEAAVAASAAATPFDPTIDPANALLLHSRPGSNRVIYLDFDGYTVSGTSWANYTGGACTADAYDTDGVPGSFSTSERNNIVSVWRRVAEDYAPFEVDVTTEDPGYDAINRSSSSDTQFGTRLIITYSKSLCPNGQTMYASICSGGCGGIAYVGVFDNTGSNHDYYQPAIVFQNGVTSNPKYVAEAASHEVGHNIGLSHDGTSTTGYYQGQGSWAPIMGVGYYRALSQWSKGEYLGANNTQDDFVVAASNGLSLRTDDFGGTPATAYALSGNPVSIDGVITSASDVDAFSFVASAGPATITAGPVPTSPDLDIRLELRDASGNLVAWSDPASGSTGYDSATGLDASISTTLAAGSYTVSVDGVGWGSPTDTGYSDYGSVGNYRLSVGYTGATGLAPVASISATVTTGTAPLVVGFDGSASTDPEGTALSYQWNFGDGSAASTETSPSHTYSTPGTYTATLTVTDGAGMTGSASTSVVVAAPVRRIDLQSITVTGTRNSSGRSSVTATLAVRDESGLAVSGATVTGRWTYGNSGVNRSATTSASGTATFSLSNLKLIRGTVVSFCMTGLSLSGAVRDTALYSPAGGDCASWIVP